MTEHRAIECERAIDGLGVGIHDELVGVPAVAGLGIPGTVDPESVACADRHVFNVSVEHVEDALRQRDPRLRAGVIEDAEIDCCGSLCPQGHVRATVPVGGDAEGVPAGTAVACHVRHATGNAFLPAPR